MNKTSQLLVNREQELKKTRYSLNEKEFIISEQRKAENALAHQACVLRADLEKALQDNASLFVKIGREDKLSSDNRAVVNHFQVELAQQVGSLCNTVATTLSEQNEHLQGVEKLCHSFLGIHDKAVIDLKARMEELKAVYVSHVEAVQNAVCLHKASSDASLEELSTAISSHGQSIQEYLTNAALEAGTIFDEFQSCLSTQKGELALFAREVRNRFNLSVEQIKEISQRSEELVEKLFTESKKT